MSVPAIICLCIFGSGLSFFIGMIFAEDLMHTYYKRWMVKNGVGKWFADKDGKPYFGILKSTKAKKK